MPRPKKLPAYYEVKHNLALLYPERVPSTQRQAREVWARGGQCVRVSDAEALDWIEAEAWKVSHVKSGSPRYKQISRGEVPVVELAPHAYAEIMKIRQVTGPTAAEKAAAAAPSVAEEDVPPIVPDEPEEAPAAPAID